MSNLKAALKFKYKLCDKSVDLVWKQHDKLLVGGILIELIGFYHAYYVLEVVAHCSEASNADELV